MQSPYLSCNGDADHMHVFGDIEFDDLELGGLIAVDRFNEDFGSRNVPPELLGSLRFRATSPQDRRIKPRFSDCIMFGSSVEPRFSCYGFVNLVSERARIALEKTLGQEAAFVPVVIEPAPSQYYALWVTSICDVIDEANTELIADPPGTGRYRLPVEISYDEAHCAAKYLFRLPAWRYHEVGDVATSAFVQLIKDSELTGFNFLCGVS